MRRFRTYVTISTILFLFLAACGVRELATATVPPSNATEPLPAPADTRAPLPTAAGPPVTGGFATLVYGEDPQTLNLALSHAWITGQVAWAIVEGLIDVGPDGSYRPVLAEDLPSLPAGTVSEDGLSVTWKLREGLQWNDGQPVTSADIQFTWQAVIAGGIDKSGYNQIASIEMPDERTAVVRYRTFYADYLGQFKFLLPAHAGAPDAMSDWAYNRAPIGTGPFMVDDWAVDDHITLVRNPHYWKESQPYLDGVVYRIVPDYDAHVRMLRDGQVDHMWIGSCSIQQVRDMPDVDLYEGDTGWMARLWLNLADPSAGGEPTPPHPILGDPQVRQAINKALDWDQIIHGIYNGIGAARATTQFYQGWYEVDIPAEPVDLEAAQALLEEAGWSDQDGDGIRECHGCTTAEPGTKMALRLEAYAYGPEWDLVRIVLQDMLKYIGIEVTGQTDEMSTMFGTFAGGAPRATGDFDMMLYDTTAGIDPQAFFYAQFHSSQIPTQSNHGQGCNWTRYVNADVDRWLEEAGATPDLETRKTLYAKIARQLAEDNPVLSGIIFTDNLAYSRRLEGWTPNPYWPQTANMEDWWIQDGK